MAQSRLSVSSHSVRLEIQPVLKNRGLKGKDNTTESVLPVSSERMLPEGVLSYFQEMYVGAKTCILFTILIPKSLRNSKFESFTKVAILGFSMTD